MPFEALLANDKDMVPVGAIDALHVAAIACVQHASRYLGADAPAILQHLRPLAQHFARDREFFVHDGRRAFFPGQFQGRFPTRHGHLARNILRECHRFLGAVLHAQHGDR
jgi:hypothetical protein